MRRIIQKIQRDFLTGLAVLIPLVLTGYLAWSVISFIDNVVIPLIPPKYNPLEVFNIYVPGMGVILFLISIDLWCCVSGKRISNTPYYLRKTKEDRVVISSKTAAKKETTQT